MRGATLPSTALTIRTTGTVFPLRVGDTSPGTPIDASGYTTTPGVPVTLQFPDWSLQVLISNNSGFPITRAYRGTASAGSFQILPGQAWTDTVNESSVSIYCAGAITINGQVPGLTVEVSG
jgi:hypothetical protein